MTQMKATTKTQRKSYSPKFKQQAVLRAVKEGVPTVAQDLGIEPAQLYAWRTKAQQQGQDAEVQRLMQSEAERLKREVARLEEENGFLKKAAAYFAKQPK